MPTNLDYTKASEVRQDPRPSRGRSYLIPLFLTDVSEVPFNGQLAYEQDWTQCAFGPRPTGSEAGRKTSDYIASQLESLGWRVETEKFDYRALSIRNIIDKRA